MPYDQKLIAERILQLRTVENDMTRKKFADKVGIGARSIEAYEYGQVCPSSYAVYAICKAFDVSADWLLGLKEGMR